ncbi:hypothetical protein [Nocardia asteroides]|uniref:hypothetical protein n=1 Tax=Nocardia asteroides TaxID=1824 RepID=UPI00365EA612
MFGLGILDAAALSLDTPDGRPREVRRVQQLAVWQAVYSTGVALATVPARELLPADALPLRCAGFAYLTAAATIALAVFTTVFASRTRYAHAGGWYGSALVAGIALFGVLTLPAVVVSVAMITLLDRSASKAWYTVAGPAEPVAFCGRATLPAWAAPLARPIGNGWKALLAER